MASAQFSPTRVIAASKRELEKLVPLVAVQEAAIGTHENGPENGRFSGFVLPLAYYILMDLTRKQRSIYSILKLAESCTDDRVTLTDDDVRLLTDSGTVAFDSPMPESEDDGRASA